MASSDCVACNKTLADTSFKAYIMQDWRHNIIKQEHNSGQTELTIDSIRCHTLQTFHTRTVAGCG